MAQNRENRLDEKALEALYVKLETPIYNVVYRWLWDAAEARDVTQEAFLNVWRARDRVDLETVEPLLYRSALNLASNRRRSRRVWRWLGLEDVVEPTSNAPTTEQEMAREETSRSVRAAIDELPEDLKQVILLVEYSEMSYEQISKALGIPSGTIGSRRTRAMKALAEKLGAIEGIEE